MQTDASTLRRELAAALRLAAKHELNEGICNHFSVALPGKDERYLITRTASTGPRCGRATSS